MEKNRYENGKIYKVIDNGYNLCYIGSTCEELSQRMARHRSFYKSYVNKHIQGRTGRNSIYDMFDEYGVDNCKIELIEECPYNTKEELLRQEGVFIQQTDCINKRVEGRTRKEYYEKKRDVLLENKKDYYKKKESEFKQKVICVCGAIVCVKEKPIHEKRSKHQQYLKEKEDINSGLCKDKIICLCGSIVPKRKLYRHEKTEKHINHQTIIENQ